MFIYDFTTGVFSRISRSRPLWETNAGFHAELSRNGHRASRSRAICLRTPEKWAPCAVWQRKQPVCPRLEVYHWFKQKPHVFDTLLGHGGSDPLIGQDQVFSLIPRLGTLSAIRYLGCRSSGAGTSLLTDASMTSSIGSMSRIGIRYLSRVST